MTEGLCIVQNEKLTRCEATYRLTQSNIAFTFVKISLSSFDENIAFRKAKHFISLSHFARIWLSSFDENIAFRKAKHFISLSLLREYRLTQSNIAFTFVKISLSSFDENIAFRKAKHFISLSSLDENIAFCRAKHFHKCEGGSDTVDCRTCNSTCISGSLACRIDVFISDCKSCIVVTKNSNR